VRLVGYLKKIITMHGNMNVKNSVLTYLALVRISL